LGLRAGLFCFLGFSFSALAAPHGVFLGSQTYRTANYTVTAGDAPHAKYFAEMAEYWRSKLSLEWLGGQLPEFPVTITVQAGPQLGAGGSTSFTFLQGQVMDFRMSVQGSVKSIAESVLPHEILHTLLAGYYRKPVPRWADEGLCTLVEEASERAKQDRSLLVYLKANRAMRVEKLMQVKEYPLDVLPLYAQSHSLTDFLVRRKGADGRRGFVRFLAQGLNESDWSEALLAHYGFDSFDALEEAWLVDVHSRTALQVTAIK